jgi:predicted nucleic acid-binding protein
MSVTRYVIDSPTLLHVIDDDLPIDPSHQLVAPNFLRSEALERLLHEVREGRRTEKAALQCHQRMTELKIRLLGDRVSRRTAWDIAVAHDWDTLRDAEYLAVTRLQADALITIDEALAAAAANIVPVAALSDLLSPDR